MDAYEKDRRTREAIDATARDAHRANRGEKPLDFYRDRTRVAHERGERNRDNSNR